ncbi:MAG: DUF92 domain-containing protein, partial [Bacillota bacterium]|nr:DUF92 domain-containing protein [Bacillota bacterium]
QTKTPVFIFAYAASFASANADTWASEIGVLSKGEPISILTLKRTQRGNSGAVSILGITASISGAVFIGFFFFTGYVLSCGWENELLTHTIVITAAGFLGSIIDSFLGALLQAKYRCVVCGKVTEKKIHHERDTEHISGIRFINNDMVNLLSCLSASVITILVLWK